MSWGYTLGVMMMPGVTQLEDTRFPHLLGSDNDVKGWEEAFASPLKARSRGTATGLHCSNNKYMIGARPTALRSLGPGGPYTLHLLMQY